MKNKKIVFGTILLLFAISGIYNVINVLAEPVDLPPASYFARGFDVDYLDELEVSVSSSGIINVYIMNEDQLNVLTDSGGLTWNYIKRWRDTTYLEFVYTIPADGKYYIVLYNKDIFSGRTVDIQIDIDYYYEPYIPTDYSYILRNLLFFVIIPIAIIGIVIIGYIIFKKESPKEIAVIQEREIPKITYCPECGTEISDKTLFCSRCGNKIIN